MVGIQPGSLLTHAQDESITCVVVDDLKVRFRDEIMRLSQSALKAFHEMGYSWKAVSGLEYWGYEGRMLDEIRRVMEDGED